MTCQHCVMSVTEEVGEIEGVRSVDVQLATGALTVVSERALDLAEIAAAVEEAGFALAP
jgi:copper chaperone CopZ